MGYDGFGNYSRVTSWQADKAAAIKITAVRHDLQDDDFGTAFNQTLLRNGVVAMGGNLKLGGNLVTGIGAGTAGSPAVSASADATTGIFFPAAGIISFAAGGVERARANNTGFNVPSGQLMGIGTNTPRTQLDVVGISSFRAAYEDTVISSTALTGVVNVDMITAPLAMYTANAAGNWTFNLRGDGSNALDSIMAIGQTLTLAIEVPQGTTAYYCTGFTIDGFAPAAVKWAGGAPSAGNISGVDIYAIRVTKTAAATYQVRASQSQEK